MYVLISNIYSSPKEGQYFIEFFIFTHTEIWDCYIYVFIPQKWRKAIISVLVYFILLNFYTKMVYVTNKAYTFLRYLRFKFSFKITHMLSSCYWNYTKYRDVILHDIKLELANCINMTERVFHWINNLDGWNLHQLLMVCSSTTRCIFNAT